MRFDDLIKILFVNELDRKVKYIVMSIEYIVRYLMSNVRWIYKDD